MAQRRRQFLYAALSSRDLMPPARPLPPSTAVTSSSLVSLWLPSTLRPLTRAFKTVARILPLLGLKPSSPEGEDPSCHIQGSSWPRWALSVLAS